MPNASIKRVTPKFAERLIKHTDQMVKGGKALKNRPVNNNRVEKYAAMMRDGQWRFTGEPIQLHPDGYLLNGQHRLHAVIKSGTTHQMVLVDGVDKDSFRVMDTGMGRRPADALMDVDVPSKSTLMAAAKLMVCHNAGLDFFKTQNLNLVTRQDQAEYVISNADFMSKWVNVAWRTYEHSGGTNTAWLTFFMMARDAGEEAALQDFIDGVRTGANLQADDPRLALRNWLLRLGQPKPQSQVIVSTIVRAFNDHLRGASRQMMRPAYSLTKIGA